MRAQSTVSLGDHVNKKCPLPESETGRHVTLQSIMKNRKIGASWTTDPCYSDLRIRLVKSLAQLLDFSLDKIDLFGDGNFLWAGFGAFVIVYARQGAVRIIKLSEPLFALLVP